MNETFTIVKKTIILNEDSLQIYHAGIIETIEEYDLILTTVMAYLLNEGFLEDHLTIENFYIFNYVGKLIFREKCL